MGRAIVRHPQVFLMDEPLSNLDAKLRVQTRTELAELQTRLGVTTVYVTHDQVEAMTMGHRVAVLHDGVLQQCDTPTKLYHEPANLFVAGFIGSPAMNVLPSPGPGPLRIAGVEVGVGADLTATRSAIGFRPEALSVGSGPLRARIRTVEDLGPEVFVHVLVDHEGEERRLDDNVSLSLNGSVHVFGEDGERIATVLSHPGLDVEIAGESV
jgi:multiple sugar transport system ATP-binding protein